MRDAGRIPIIPNLSLLKRAEHARHPAALFPRPFLLAIFCAALAAAGCGHRTYTTRAPAPAPSAPPPAVETQPVVPGQWVEEGVASWYGAPFDGRRTSNGEIYDMHQFTAAHRTLPFGSLVRVTNLSNGMQTQIRVNDRGPFVGNRVIDLSYSAAQAIQMVGPGTAHVRLEVIGGPNPQVGFFAVQVGAFLSTENATRFREQMSARYSPVTVVNFDSPKGMFYRVRVGRFPTEDAAKQLAASLHESQQLTTFVVRLDE